MEEKTEEKKANIKKDKKLRSVSVVSDARKVSFSKKTLSEDDLPPKRRTKSFDISAGSRSLSDVEKTSSEETKSNVLFSISENADTINDESKAENASDNESIAITLASTAEILLTSNDDREFPVNDTSSETQSDLPQTRENSAHKHPRRASSVTPSDTSSYASSNSTALNNTTSLQRNTASYSNPSKTNMKPAGVSARRESTVRFRKTSALQGAQGDDVGSRIIKMALKREWTQLEISLRYMEKLEPGFNAVDDVSINKDGPLRAN